MTTPSCLWACTFNLCFQNPADSALVIENNWPTLQCWLLLLLLRSVQRLICQQPPESRGGRAQRCPRRCRLATLSSSLSPKSQHFSKVSAAAADETIRWRLQFSFGSPLTAETLETNSNVLQVKSHILTESNLTKVLV